MTDPPKCRNRGCPSPTSPSRLICEDCADERYERYRERAGRRGVGMEESTTVEVEG